MTSHWSTNRMEAFSDGVFAIAITLLILEVHVPASEFDHLWRGIAHQWPAYLAYATSFLTIGGIWMIHHAVFRRLASANQRLMVLNLLLLMATAFLPFPTKLMAEAVHNEDTAQTAVIFYGLSLLTISLLLNALWATAAHDRHVLRPDVGDDEIKAIAIATAPNIGLYVGMLVLTLFAARVAIFGYLVIAVVAVLRSPGDQSRIRVTE